MVLHKMDLGENGLVGYSGVFPQLRFLFLLIAALRVFSEAPEV